VQLLCGVPALPGALSQRPHQLLDPVSNSHHMVLGAVYMFARRLLLPSHHAMNICCEFTGRHGVPREVIDAHFKASEEFFALPPEKKMLKVPK
jgi:hypothetical protein